MTPIPQQKILTRIDDHHRHNSTTNHTDSKKKIQVTNATHNHNLRTSIDHRANIID